MTTTATATRTPAKSAPKKAAHKSRPLAIVTELPDPAKNRAARRAAAKAKIAGARNLGELEAALTEAVKLVEPKASKTASTKKAAAAPAPVVLDVAGMDPAKRLTIASAEAKATKAWKAAGSKGTAPATPVLDWMNDTPKNERKSTSKPRTEGKARIVVPDAEMGKLAKLVTSMREKGASWKAISAATADLPTSYTENQVYVLAKRHGWNAAKK